MVNNQASALDATFSALSDATRRAILAQLAGGESSVSELAAPYRMSLPAVSKHLKVLEGAGLIIRAKEGRVHRCRLVVQPMKNASDWLAQYRKFWETQFDSLAKFLAQSQQQEKQPWQAPSQVPQPRSKSVASSRRPAKKSSRRGPKKNS